MALITCKDLALGYEGKAILTGLNFTVQPGDYLCIVGENGSGKSTLMKTLLSLNPPISGSIVYGNGIRSNQIGYLPQQTVIQKDFPASVREVVLSGCQSRCGFRPFYRKEEKKLAENAMQKMDILNLSSNCYRDLSGGQQQRVLLARALCAAQKILLLDEPVSGLDPLVTSEMYQLIEELNRKDHMTILMISHDIHAALKYASHILHIGSHIFYGTREEYLSRDIGRTFSDTRKIRGNLSANGNLTGNPLRVPQHQIYDASYRGPKTGGDQ